MTALPEAKLAREAEICFAVLACSTDYDCWHETHEDVTAEMIVANLLRNVEVSRGPSAPPSSACPRRATAAAATRSRTRSSPRSTSCRRRRSAAGADHRQVHRRRSEPDDRRLPRRPGHPRRLRDRAGARPGRDARQLLEAGRAPTPPTPSPSSTRRTSTATSGCSRAGRATGAPCSCTPDSGLGNALFAIGDPEALDAAISLHPGARFSFGSLRMEHRRVVEKYYMMTRPQLMTRMSGHARAFRPAEGPAVRLAAPNVRTAVNRLYSIEGG